ncbi:MULTISPECIES: stage II sporulation protein M [Paenibacillus]|jgi:stage II sporulation protein M|uniref:Stage II sporulation protein M n=2 Tax=Paenibacillus TaxID=44249 RepID=A0AAJ3J0R6_PAEPO|nr:MULTISPECIES: stage II sporulation protein M [Paenibacillus]ALA44048.1 membrane protein [Paenibacillus peoriae]APQ61340.1 membrane protein [Paenibacillus polymyxa]MCP3748051.1 stage II sporulation protein M [Paenibacillus sp. A3M_27_13]MDH2334316.1 stage II sporulation protein M [Paenibacillus polymyxa]MDR6781282.1 stage II sporulation protein M [Paenibacillus peoriae]
MGLKAFFHDLHTTRRLILISAFLFCTSIMVGWLSTGTIQSMLAQQMEGLGEVAQRLQNSEHPQWSFFVFIFFNNAIKCVLVIFMGAVFGIVPFIFLIVNGMVLGFVVHLQTDMGRSMYEVVVKGLLPHGVIELPVLIIACAFGLKFGINIMSTIGTSIGLKRKGTGPVWDVFMKQTLRVSIWSVILLLIAAAIESGITYRLLSQ